MVRLEIHEPDFLRQNDRQVGKTLYDHKFLVRQAGVDGKFQRFQIRARHSRGEGELAMNTPSLLGANFSSQLRLPERQQCVEIQHRKLCVRKDCRPRQPFRLFYQFRPTGDSLQGHPLQKQMMRRSHVRGGKLAGHLS